MVASILLINLVSAASIAEDITKALDNAVSAGKPLISQILGNVPSGEWLFAKFLFFLIIFAIVWTALNRIEFFSEKTWVLAIITIAASILATRWIGGEGVIRTIVLPYSALGIALTAALPFIIYFLLVNVGLSGQVPTVRRVAWIFFAVIFIGLWISRYSVIESDARYIYPVTALAAFIMAVMDGTIHKFFAKVRSERAAASGKTTGLIAIDRQINDTHTNYSSMGSGYQSFSSTKTGSAGYRADIEHLKKIRKTLMSS